MRTEKVTQHTTLLSMEDSDLFGWGGCDTHPFKLLTLRQEGGESFTFEDLFAENPTATQIERHESRASRAFATYKARGD